MLCRVSPFGDPRINAHLQLHAAFRSLLRPSSALSAKASTLRSCLLTSIHLPTCDFVFSGGWHREVASSLPAASIFRSGVLRLTPFSMFLKYFTVFLVVWIMTSVISPASDVFSLLFRFFFMWFSRCKPVSLTDFFIYINPSGCYIHDPGTHLLSHAVSSIVSSADRVLTIVFGMGTGVSPDRIGTGNMSLPTSVTE